MRFIFDVDIGLTSLRRGRGSSIKFVGAKKSSVGANFFCRRHTSILVEGGSLIIGKNVFFNNYSSVACLESITIGDDCLFGEGVRIYDHNHQFSDVNKVIGAQGYSLGAIKIGNNCWIGSNSIILKGITIGSGVVIGANCLIYKNIETNSLVRNGPNGLVITKRGEPDK